MSFATPLRYPGGKGRLGRWIGEIISTNGLSNGTYIEPYAGGAGAAALLLTKGMVRRIHINDIDPALYSFWKVLVDNSKELVKLIRSSEVTMDARDRAKDIVRHPDGRDPLVLAFSTLLLNRTSRSGILMGGPIGGRHQLGKYKIDARFNREAIIARIEAIASAKNRIIVTNLDAAELLSGLASSRSKKLVYCDPPYYVKGYQLYKNHYDHNDHRKISEIMQGLRCPWIVTYDNHPSILDLYKFTQHQTFSLQYSTHTTRKESSEMLFYNKLTLHRPPFLHR